MTEDEKYVREIAGKYKTKYVQFALTMAELEILDWSDIAAIYREGLKNAGNTTH